MHNIMSVAGHLAQVRLCLSRMKGSLPTAAMGSWEGQKGNCGKIEKGKSVNSSSGLAS